MFDSAYKLIMQYAVKLKHEEKTENFLELLRSHERERFCANEASCMKQWEFTSKAYVVTMIFAVLPGEAM